MAALALAPLGHVYGAVTARRMAKAGFATAIPVVCVGNFVAGGAGKTPTALAIARRLEASGRAPAFLSRGYGGRLSRCGVTRVDPARHVAAEVGDEPLLLARQAPTFVAADRRAGAAAAIAAGADILVLDDGLQNPSLRKDLSIAVVDGAAGVGNGFCMPAGPLRAPLARQWPNVSLLCLIGPGAPGEDVARTAAAAGLPMIRGRLVPEAAALDALRGRRIFAFAGIGRPEKFFATLAEHGLDVVGRRSFADHHPYAPADLAALTAAAAGLGAVLVTTEKDRMRLDISFAVLCLPVRLVFADATPLDALLARLR
jgi:tetraacyldisaccharide 4'-kinase